MSTATAELERSSVADSPPAAPGHTTPATRPEAARESASNAVDSELEKAVAGASAKGYLAGGPEYFYPEDGDPTAPGGADVHLLTIGGVCVRGPWQNDGRYLGWAPLPKRNEEREARILARRTARRVGR